MVVGTSWGGLDAVGRLLAALPDSFGCPIVVVQHRGAGSPAGVMRTNLQRRTALAVVDAEDKEPIAPSTVYLAPPDYHVLVEPGSLALSLDAPVAYSRPSIDVALESAAESYGPSLAAVVLTGANADGAAGAAAVKRAGGQVYVQHPADAERPEMPEAVISAVAPDGVDTVEGLAARLGSQR
ncbi:MAG TPA: chemotaxis protein CheB [Acidimicrobiales bacterium]|nr:chemotaxis protein CheB [Acidimicrobiales bacterium]